MSDLEQVKLLSIFHYVVAGLMALFACIPFIHLFMGIAFLSGWMDDGHPSDARWAGWLFIGIAVVIIACGWTFAALTALAGKRLSRHTHYTYCLVMAGILCIFTPFGTVLGVFTLIVLLRPSVKALFGQPVPMPPAAVV